MFLLTVNDIHIIMGTTLSKREITEHCQNKNIYGWKSMEQPARWLVPSESFAMYLRYNPSLKRIFYNQEKEILGDEKMSKYKRIKDELENATSIANEEYKLADLTDILEIDFINWLRNNHSINAFQRRFPKFSSPIPVVRVIRYLHENPEAHKKLENLHMKLVSKNDLREPMVRHLLMLYTYYISNGYLL